MIYPIPPSLYCVPSAIAAITGADPASVIIPALHRHRKDPELLGQVGGVNLRAHAIPVLEELGYVCREPKDKSRHRLSTWAERSLTYGALPLLVSTSDHCLVLHASRVYDTFTPHGADPTLHPFRNSVLTYVALVQPR